MAYFHIGTGCWNVKAQAAHDIFVEMQLKILHCIVKFDLVISLIYSKLFSISTEKL